MAEEKERGGLWKAISSSIIGLFSGAVLMYVSPLVNSAIKPPRPVPNFAYSAEGPQVTFTNRSTGGTQGWWDFGDGSALEAFSPSQGAIVHRFPGPGNFSVKLSLNNLIGEEADRTVTVRVEAGPVPEPVIEELQVVPVTPTTAPATFRVVARVKNAELALWSVDDQPLDLVGSPANQLERYVTFTYYGHKKIRLLAVNDSGKNRAEKEAEVWVDVPGDEPRILIYPSTVRSWTESIPFSACIPPSYSGNQYPFEVTRNVPSDSLILEAHLDQTPSPKLVQNPQLLLGADRKSVVIRGELMRPAGGGVPPSWFGKIELKLGSRVPSSSPQATPVVGKLQLPGRTSVALPPRSMAMAGMRWEVRQGMDRLMADTKVPVAQVVRVRNQPYRVFVHQEGDQIVIDTESAGTPAVNTSTTRPSAPR